MYKQLEIRWVNLNPTQGAETQKQRPCVILQSNMMNAFSQTYIVAPLLPNHKDWQFVVNINPNNLNGLDKPCHINLKQLRAVDISRISNKQGDLDAYYLPKIHEVLKIIFDFYE
jgi:mRNA interferase MazF